MSFSLCPPPCLSSVPRYVGILCPPQFSYCSFGIHLENIAEMCQEPVQLYFYTAMSVTLCPPPCLFHSVPGHVCLFLSPGMSVPSVPRIFRAVHFSQKFLPIFSTRIMLKVLKSVLFSLKVCSIFHCCSVQKSGSLNVCPPFLDKYLQMSVPRYVGTKCEDFFVVLSPELNKHNA